MAQPGISIREMCELIARRRSENANEPCTWREVMDSSPDPGEILNLYLLARMHFKMFTHDALPLTAAQGDYAIIPTQEGAALYLYSGTSWHPLVADAKVTFSKWGK